MENSLKDFQEEPQSQNIAYRWYQEKEPTYQDRQYTKRKSNVSKATTFLSSTKVITMVDRIHLTQQ